MPSPRALPFRAGPYECYHYLGGNLAELYLARDQRTGFNRVVKLLGAGYGVDSELMQRFVAEGRAALQCQHPNIVTTYEADQVDGLAYIAMEHLQGSTLKVLLERGGLRSMNERINVAWQVARGLSYLHQRNIVHRDVKPENVNLDAAGTVKIFDFGVARQRNQQITKEGQVLGTPLYMAPEQLRGEPISAAVDIYSYGVLLFVMFTGRFPIRGVSREDLFAAAVFFPPDLSPLEGKDIPQAIVALITQCLQKQPSERPASFQEIEMRLRPMVTMKEALATSAPAVPRLRLSWIVWVAAGLMVAAGCLVAYWFRQQPKPIEPRLISKGGFMVLVPAGPARLGRDLASLQVGTFYIDRTEVSNEAYREFATATNRPVPATMRDLPASFPAVNVSYDEAVAFCQWVGERLPTDVEWEKAARGEAGQTYPWGDQPRFDLANVPHSNEPHELQPVESNLSGASPYGAINMLGNVWEWVEKQEQLEDSDIRDEVLNPPVTRQERAYQIRGGSFLQGIDLSHAVWDFAVAPARLRRADVGFRCARGYYDGLRNMSVLHPNLSGRVAVVTGASRGIGKALALRLAQEGADVVIAAKSEASTVKLPGSIYDTANEVRALGRRALAVPTDVRNEEAIAQMVEKTVAEFGRIDILVNNAGAIWTQPILATPPKKFDLMMQINVRAAYIACYYALPHMVKQKWGHVLNMCPRLHTDASPGKVAYMISKLGMARVAIGLAAEHKSDNVAANTLWPRTIIESQASINWNMADRSQWRTPEILCDASMAIFGQEPRSFTGREMIDEDVLRELADVDNFDKYWCLGKAPENPIYIDRW